MNFYLILRGTTFPEKALSNIEKKRSKFKYINYGHICRLL